MTIVQMLLKELNDESQVTRKMLERVPEDKFAWRPHEKSMTMMQLTTHIAELPGWVAMAVTTDGLDFATMPYQPTVVNSTAELLELFEKSLEEGRSKLAEADDEKLEESWILRNGEQILMTDTKGGTVRMSLSQIIHHRAQLGVYLRLLNVPIPGTYGPSADEDMGMTVGEANEMNA